MNVAEELLRGPRGRRLCLASLTQTDPAIGEAVIWAAHRLDPDAGTLIRLTTSVGDIDELPPAPTYSEPDVAALIRRADLTRIAPDTARAALRDSVDTARYWQQPDGTDVLASLPDIRDALSHVAVRLVTALPDLTAPAATDQWAVQWVEPSESTPLPQHSGRILADWTAELREAERREAERRASRWRRYRRSRANVSGDWWSVPTELLATRRNQPDALEFVEDAFTWHVATVIPVRGAGRVLEIDTPEAWADLCRRFPFEVTASRRHDWFRVTARDGRWLLPDWQRVAAEWDAVHLTALGYLSSATRLIRVDDEYASVIGGWAPDYTLWLTDVARERDEPRQQWTSGTGAIWTRSRSA